MTPNEDPIILSLDMATEFYLGMYRVDGESSAGTCWLKHSVDGWKVSITDFNLWAGRDEGPCFRPAGQGSIFSTKEHALEKFTQWTRQEYKENRVPDAFEHEMELRISNLEKQTHSEHAHDEMLGVEFALAHYQRVKTMRRAANRMNDSDNFQTNAALDNIEGMIIHDTFVCNVSPNYVITENATILAEEVGMEAD